MEELVGKIINKIEMAGDELMVFTTNEGEFAYETYGECCSVSWFSHITNLQALLGQKVNEVVEREEFTEEEQKKAEAEPRNANYGDYDSLALYGILLKTDKGTCDIEFRNDSNGYYGGSVEKTTLSENAQERKELKEVKEDF